MTIFVGGLSIQDAEPWTEEKLRHIFDRFGSIERVQLVRPVYKRSCFAFLTFADSEAASLAVQEEFSARRSLIGCSKHIDRICALLPARPPPAPDLHSALYAPLPCHPRRRTQLRPPIPARSSSLLLDLAALAAALAAYPLAARAALAACPLTAVGARCLPARRSRCPRRLPAHRRRRPLPTRSPLALPSPPASTLASRSSPPASSPPSALAARRPPSLSALVPHASSSLTPLPSHPRCPPRRLPPCPVNTGACLTPAPPPSCPLPALPRPRPACQNTSPAHCDHPSCRAMMPSSSPLFASTHSRAPCRAGAPAGPAPSAAASFL
ncbi:hypothetical protein ACG7TL_000514 [Trametes sanguinea]